MKGIVLLIFFLIFFQALNAQEISQDTAQVLKDTIRQIQEKEDPIEKIQIPWSVYVEFLPEFAPQPDQYGLHYQYGMGATFRWINVGGFINFQKENIRKTLIFPNDFDLIYLHGGAYLGGRIFNYKRIAMDLRYNYSMGSLVWENSETKKDLVRENFSLSKPELILQYHILNYISVFTSTGYKIGHGIAIPGIEKNDFNGFTLGVGMKIGFFHLVF